MSPLWTKRTSGFALKGADACKRTPDREQRLALRRYLEWIETYSDSPHLYRS
jgi:hypothetical protein